MAQKIKRETILRLEKLYRKYLQDLETLQKDFKQKVNGFLEENRKKKIESLRAEILKKKRS